MCLLVEPYIRIVDGVKLIDMRRRIKPEIRGFKIFRRVGTPSWQCAKDIPMVETPYRRVRFPPPTPGTVITADAVAYMKNYYQSIYFYKSVQSAESYRSASRVPEEFPPHAVCIRHAVHGYRYKAGVIHWLLQEGYSFLNSNLIYRLNNMLRQGCDTAENIRSFDFKSCVDMFNDHFAFYEVDFNEALIGGFDTVQMRPIQRTVAGISYKVIKEVPLTEAELKPHLVHALKYMHLAHPPTRLWVSVKEGLDTTVKQLADMCRASKLTLRRIKGKC